MNKSAFNYIAIMSLLMLLSSCASKTYEWVKINPEKIAMAKAAIPYSDNVRYVDIRVNAKHKAENITYVENSTEYFSNPVFEPKGVNRTIPRRTVTKRSNASNVNNTPKVKAISKHTVKSVSKAQSASKQEVEERDISMSKLNSALILPKKKKKLQATHPVQENANPEKATISTSHAKESEAIAEPAKNNTVETINHDNGLSQLEDLDKELSNNDQKISEDQPIPDQHIKEEASKRNSYMWIGLVLLIVGLIIGLIFGGLAYLISFVGIVFLLIGYFTKI